MGRTHKRSKRLYESNESYAKSEKRRKGQRKEKRIDRALRNNDFDSLMEMED